jgi:hypothetical protein
VPDGRGETQSRIAERLRAVEHKLGKHEDLIRRTLEIATRYFLSQNR